MQDFQAPMQSRCATALGKLGIPVGIMVGLGNKREWY